MSVVCSKGKSTWCKCQASHDLFSPYCHTMISVFRSDSSTIKAQTSPKHALPLTCTANGLSGECFLRWIEVLTYLSFALNQGWNKDGHLVCFWQWKTPDSSVTHIEAKRSFSYSQFHSRERNSPLSKFDTLSCGALRQCIALVDSSSTEFKQRLKLFLLTDTAFKDLPPLRCLTSQSALYLCRFFFFLTNWFSVFGLTGLFCLLSRPCSEI